MLVVISNGEENGKGILRNILITQSVSSFSHAANFIEQTLSNWEKSSYSEVKNIRIDILEG